MLSTLSPLDHRAAAVGVVSILAFSVKSLDEFTEKLHKLGYEYLYEPFDLNGKGTKIAFVKDPDGYEIELIEKVIW